MKKTLSVLALALSFVAGAALSAQFATGMTWTQFTNM